MRHMIADLNGYIMAFALHCTRPHAARGLWALTPLPCGQRCCHWTVNNQPRFPEQKNKNPDKEKSSDLQIPPKLTTKCGIILHNKYKHSNVKHSNDHLSMSTPQVRAMLDARFPQLYFCSSDCLRQRAYLFTNHAFDRQTYGRGQSALVFYTVR